MSDMGNVNITLQSMMKATQAEAKQLDVAQDVAEDAFLNKVQEATNPFAHKKLTKKSLADRKKRISKAQKAEKGGMSSEKVEKAASKFEKRNPELKKKMLMLLRENAKEGDSAKEILDKVQKFYSDPALADEAMEFLEETTGGELQDQVKQARDKLNKDKGREIKAGRNMGAQARKFSSKGLGSPTALRDLYREITGNPKDARTLFDDLAGRFEYKELKQVVKFFFHSLGSDMKAKGPSIPRGLLQNLMKQTRALQSILGVFKFFQSRVKLMTRLFDKSGIDVPKKLTFELMSKQFMKLVSERYPSSDKCLQTTKRLGVDKTIVGKIITLSQMRDAIRQVASQYIYKSNQHRDDLLMALVEALEDLEDDLEEYEDSIAEKEAVESVPDDVSGIDEVEGPEETGESEGPITKSKE